MIRFLCGFDHQSFSFIELKDFFALGVLIMGTPNSLSMDDVEPSETLLLWEAMLSFSNPRSVNFGFPRMRGDKGASLNFVMAFWMLF